MKKLLLMASAVVLSLSCSSSDENSDENSDNGSNNNSSKITPPAWIHGKWLIDSSVQSGYSFYSDDICQLHIGSYENCMKEAVNIYNGTQVFTNVEQYISETEYKCKITISSQVLNYHFVKINNTTIKDMGLLNTNGEGVLLFKKQ